MIDQVILVSHFGLASGMKKAVSFILGERDDLLAVELDDAGIEKYKQQLALLDIQKNSKIVLVSDIPSGFPGTTAYVELSANHDVTLISGMNLPLLIELLLMKKFESAETVIPKAIQSAQGAIIHLSVNQVEEQEDEF